MTATLFVLGRLGVVSFFWYKHSIIGDLQGVDSFDTIHCIFSSAGILFRPLAIVSSF